MYQTEKGSVSSFCAIFPWEVDCSGTSLYVFHPSVPLSPCCFFHSDFPSNIVFILYYAHNILTIWFLCFFIVSTDFLSVTFLICFCSVQIYADFKDMVSNCHNHSTQLFINNKIMESVKCLCGVCIAAVLIQVGGCNYCFP